MSEWLIVLGLLIVVSVGIIVIATHSSSVDNVSSSSFVSNSVLSVGGSVVASLPAPLIEPVSSIVKLMFKR